MSTCVWWSTHICMQSRRPQPINELKAIFVQAYCDKNSDAFLSPNLTSFYSIHNKTTQQIVRSKAKVSLCVCPCISVCVFGSTFTALIWWTFHIKSDAANATDASACCDFNFCCSSEQMKKTHDRAYSDFAGLCLCVFFFVVCMCHCCLFCTFLFQFQQIISSALLLCMMLMYSYWCLCFCFYSVCSISIGIATRIGSEKKNTTRKKKEIRNKHLFSFTW